MRTAALQPCVCLGTLALAVLCFPDAFEAVMESDRFAAPVLATEIAPSAEVVTLTPVFAHPGAREGAQVTPSVFAEQVPKAATGEHFEPFGVRAPDVLSFAGARGLQ